MTLVTSAPFLAKRIGSFVFSTDRTEFDITFLLLVHWFAKGGDPRGVLLIFAIAS